MGKRGEQLQAEILAVMRARGGALSAYDVLGALQPAHPKIAPPTVYRALAALTERGDVHRLESLNAFIACQCAAHNHASILSICDKCGTVEENSEPDIFSKITSVLSETGFSVQRHVVEVHGQCADCGTGDPAQ